MKKLAATLMLIVILPACVFSQLADIQHDTTAQKTHKEKKVEKKALRKQERKDLNQHFRIGLVGTYASLNSLVRFEGPFGLLSSQIDFERHLGLEDRKSIFSASFLYRITPRSGLYAAYYGLNRDVQYALEDDIIFLDDTIKKGIAIGGYFNTQVFSIGYLLSLIKSEKSYLGAYFNVYVINIGAGVYSEVFELDRSTGVLAPLPNFGLLAVFELKKWLSISGGVGMFFLNAEGLNGSFNDAHILVEFSPAKWVGISVGYYLFDVRVGWPVEEFRAYAEYNFSGPSLGLSFRF